MRRPARRQRSTQVFCQGEHPVTDAATAEMAKLVENAFRDVNIAFANELSMICDDLGIDVWEVIELANHHPRVNILQPGPGVGGHCIAVDPWFIVAAAPDEARLIRTAREINDAKPDWVVQQVQEAVGGRTPTIAALGWPSRRTSTTCARPPPSNRRKAQLQAGRRRTAGCGAACGSSPEAACRSRAT